MRSKVPAVPEMGCDVEKKRGGSQQEPNSRNRGRPGSHIKRKGHSQGGLRWPRQKGEPGIRARVTQRNPSQTKKGLASSSKGDDSHGKGKSKKRGEDE